MPINESRPFKIAIRIPNWVGDVCMAIPFIEGVKKSYPGSFLTVLTRPHLKAILDHTPAIDSFVNVEADKNARGFLGRMREGRILAKKHFDLVYCLPNSAGAAWQLFCAGIALRVGYERGWRRLLLNKTISSPKKNGRYYKCPMPLYFNKLLEATGQEQTETRPKLYYSTTDKEKCLALLKDTGVDLDKDIYLMLPGAAFGSAKCWPAEYFGQLAKMIKKDLNGQMLVPLGPGEEEAGKVIQDISGNDTWVRAVGLDLLKPLVELSCLVISNDSGTRQYALAYQKPLLVFYGPTELNHTAINLEETKILLKQNCPLQPCRQKICPTDHRCMREITPEEALDELKKLRVKS